MWVDHIGNVDGGVDYFYNGLERDLHMAQKSAIDFTSMVTSMVSSTVTVDASGSIAASFSSSMSSTVQILTMLTILAVDDRTMVNVLDQMRSFTISSSVMLALDLIFVCPTQRILILTVFY